MYKSWDLNPRLGSFVASSTPPLGMLFLELQNLGTEESVRSGEKSFLLQRLKPLGS